MSTSLGLQVCLLQHHKRIYLPEQNGRMHVECRKQKRLEDLPVRSGRGSTVKGGRGRSKGDTVYNALKEVKGSKFGFSAFLVLSQELGLYKREGGLDSTTCL